MSRSDATLLPVAAAIALLLAACGPDPGDPLPLPEPDPVVWADALQEPMARSCAKTKCHGDVDRPYRLYSRNALRMEGKSRGSALSDEELEANVSMSAGFGLGWDVVEDPDRSLLLLKPLAPSAGGVEHEGEDVWDDALDPDYVMLREWLLGEPK